MVASRETTKKPTVEDLESVYISIIKDPYIYRALGMKSLYEARRQLERQNLMVEKNNAQKEQLEGLKKKLFETVNSDGFLNSLHCLAIQFEEQTYSVANPKISPKNIESDKGCFVYGYDMFGLIEKSLETRSRIVDFYPEQVMTSEEESFARRSAVVMDMDYWNIVNGNDALLLKSIVVNLKIAISHLSINFFYILEEVNLFNEDMFISGLNFVYSINPNTNLETFIKDCSKKKRTYSKLEDDSIYLYDSYCKLRKDYLEYLFNSQRSESIIEFFEKLISKIEILIEKNIIIAKTTKQEITQEQIDSIFELSYWEILHFNTSEENPELISLYNRRLAELVSEGVADAINFVSQNTKMLEFYQNKEFKDLLTALKTKFEIPFINEGEINPNGQRVLNALSGINFETSPEKITSEEIKIRVFVKSKWRKIIESYNDVNRNSLFKDCQNYINLIEKYGGVSAFIQQIKSNTELDYYNHKGSNRMGIDLSNAWIFRIGSNGGRIAFDLETNEVVYVGMHYEG
jgi:hypothetical protein